MDDLFTQYLEARRAADRAKERLKLAEEALLEDMEAKQRKTLSGEQDGMKYKITFVRPERVEVDEKGLRKALTAKVYDKYTKRVLDRKALEEAMETGEVDQMTVSKHITLKKAKPYLRATEKKVED